MFVIMIDTNQKRDRWLDFELQSFLKGAVRWVKFSLCADNNEVLERKF